MNSQPQLKVTGERLMSSFQNATAAEHLHRYGFALQFVQDKVVLDIASGEGYGSNLLSQRAKFVYGIDISEEAVGFAQAKYKSENLSFRKGSTSNTLLESQSIDVIVSFETIEHHDQHEEMLTEFKRILKPNGVVLISSPDKYFFSDKTNYRNEFHVKELYSHEFIALIGKYFKHYAFYKQGIIKGSLIYHAERPSTALYSFASGDFERIEQTSDLENPMYNLIAASDLAFEQPAISIFESQYVDSELVRQVELYQGKYDRMVRSWPYKIALFISMPFRIFTKLLRILRKV